VAYDLAGIKLRPAGLERIGCPELECGHFQGRRGALARQRRGRWDTTVRQCMGSPRQWRSFSQIYEKTPITGTGTASLENTGRRSIVSARPTAKHYPSPGPAQKSALTLQTRAPANPGRQSAASSPAIRSMRLFVERIQSQKNHAPVEQKERERWSRGDLVRLNWRSRSSPTHDVGVWSDPTGLGHDSRQRPGTRLGRS